MAAKKSSSLARTIAEEIAPENWETNDPKRKSLVEELGRIIDNDARRQREEDEWKRRAPSSLKGARDGAKTNAATFRAAAAALANFPALAVDTVEAFEELLDFKGNWGSGYEPEWATKRVQRALERAAEAEDTQAEGYTTQLASRDNYLRTDPLVQELVLALERVGIDPTAYIDPRSPLPCATGHLVTAAAMVRGEAPLKAGWVVKAAERIRERRRSILKPKE